MFIHTYFCDNYFVGLYNLITIRFNENYEMKTWGIY